MRRVSAPRATALGAVLLLLAAFVAGRHGGTRVFLAAWLAAWWCCVGIVMGACINLWLHRLTGGRWGDVLRPAAALLMVRRWWLGPLFVPIAVGVTALYPWASPHSDVLSTLDEPAFARAWLDLPAFASRMLLYGLVWFWLSRSALRPVLSRRRAAASLIIHSLLGSLAAIDLLMSLTPGWRSTGFALLVLVSQALAGAAALTAWTAWRLPATLRSTAAPEVPVGRDLGNLLLMYVLTWGYLGFMQFLIIWAENLPNEISWFVPRLQTGWFNVGLALVGLQLALPVAALVMRPIKDRPATLGATAGLLLLANALDSVWLVVPSVDPHAAATWWLAPLCMAGIGLLVFAPMFDAGMREVANARA